MKNLEPRQLAAALRPLQIIIAAMFAGAAAFLVLALALAPEHPPQGAPIIAYAAAGVAAGALVVRFLLPAFIIGRGIAKLSSGEQGEPPGGLGEPLAEADPEVRQLYGLYATSKIVRGTVVEGPCLLATVAYLQERSHLALAIAAVLLVILATEIRTRTGLLNWLDARMNRLETARARRRT